MKRMKYVLSALALAAWLCLGLATLAGCDSADAPIEGRVQVRLTDAPLDEMVAAHVTIERVELVGEHDGEDARIVLSDAPQPFDLLTLQNGITANVADVLVPEGRYHQLRLIVAEDAVVEFLSGKTETLKVPSGTETGIKVLLPAFDIDDDQDDVIITIDFDAALSFVYSGDKYLFKPVIKPLALEVNDVALEVAEDPAP
jgi:hypothetical protein